MSWATDAPGDGGKAAIAWVCWCPGWSWGQGTVSPPRLGTRGDTGPGLTLATGSLLRVATRLSFLTWVLVFMASQMAFSVAMGMSCGKGTWCHQGRGGIPQGTTWVSPGGCKRHRGGVDVTKGTGASPRGCWMSPKGCHQQDMDAPGWGPARCSPWGRPRMGTNAPETPHKRDQPQRDTPGQRAAPWDRVTKPMGTPRDGTCHPGSTQGRPGDALGQGPAPP